MRPVSERFSVTESYKVVTKAVILPSGVEVPITAGSVTLDSNAQVRARGDFTIADDGSLGLVPTDTAAALAPYGNEIQVFRGLEYLDGTVELISLAILRIEQATVSDSGGELSVRVSGLDRAQRIIDAKFEEPYQVAAGTNFVTAISDTILAAWPDVETDFPTTTHTTPLLVAQEGEDRWAFCQGLAKAVGAELYFDGDGILVLRQIAEATSPVLTVSEGEGEMLLEADLDWTRETARNRWIVSGENAGETGAIPRGVATDDDPTSPTYYFGSFGAVPDFWASEYVTSDDQAADAAAALLAKHLGTTKALNFGALVHPALEPGDPVQVVRSRLSLDETVVLDSLTIPLEAGGAMSASTRAIQVL